MYFLRINNEVRNNIHGLVVFNTNTRVLHPNNWTELNNSDSMWLMSHFYLYNNYCFHRKLWLSVYIHILLLCSSISTLICLACMFVTYYFIQSISLCHITHYLFWTILTTAFSSISSGNVLPFRHASLHRFSCINNTCPKSILVFILLFTYVSSIDNHLRINSTGLPKTLRSQQ